jgi:hypothetical protein
VSKAVHRWFKLREEGEEGERRALWKRRRE